MGKKKSRKKKPKNGEVVISEYAKRQAELAAAVEEDARKERKSKSEKDAGSWTGKWRWNVRVRWRRKGPPQ